MTRTNRLSLRGIDAEKDSSVKLRFAAGGQEFDWTFKAATLDELVALALSGRLGKGRDVHFDGAKVSYRKGRAGQPDEVAIAIGRKVKIVAPLPANAGEPVARKRRRKRATVSA